MTIKSILTMKVLNQKETSNWFNKFKLSTCWTNLLGIRDPPRHAIIIYKHNCAIKRSLIKNIYRFNAFLIIFFQSRQ